MLQVTGGELPVLTQLEPGMLYSIIQSFSDAVIVFDAEGKILFRNNTAETLFGCTDLEQIGRWLALMIPGRYGTAHMEGAQRPVNTGMPREVGKPVEVSVCTKDGREIPVELTITPLETGRAVAFVGVLRDISERKQQENLVSEIQERYRLISENTKNVIACLNGDGALEYVSPAARTLLGYEPDELIGKHPREFLHPDDMEQINHLVAKIGRGEDDHDFMCRLRHKTGRYVWFEMVVRTVRDDQGRLLRLISVGRDISEQKELEGQLARLKQQNELILTGAAEGIFGFDAEGKATFVNPAAASMLGYTEDEFVGKPQHLLIHHTKADGSEYPDEDCPIQTSVRQGISRVVADDVFWRKDGTSFPVQYTSTPIVENGKITGGVVWFRDITQQKKMSEQLAHAVRIAGLGHWDWDVVTDEFTASDQMHRIFGLTPGESEFTYKKFLEFVHPDDVETVQHAMLHSLQRGTPLDCEWRIIRKDGSTRHLHGQGEVLFDRTGSPLRMIGTVHDITEWKEQERLLYESEQRYQSLVKYNPNGVCALDVTGRYTDVNEAFEKIVGYTKDELLGRRFQEMVIFPEDVPLAERLFQAALNGESLKGVELTYRRKDGQGVDVSMTTAPILVHDKLVGLYAIIRDVTEQKLSRQQLMQSEARYRQLVESSLDAIGIHDGNKWLFMNGPGLEMFGAASDADMIGKPVCDFVDPDHRATFMEHSRTIIQDKKAIGRTEQRWLTVDGRHLYSETIGLPIDYENKAAVQVIIRDITERKRSEALLLKSEKLSAVGQLAAGVAHEIRNPLTALKGFTQLLNSSCTGPEKRFLEIMQNELDRIDVILNELLILAKPQAVRFTPQPIGTILKEVITLLTTEAVLKNVLIESNVDCEGPLVNCDKNQLKQVFVNIIKNAIEAMPKGGRLSITARIQDDMVCIQFTDEGEGIPEDLIPKLGEPFFTTKEKGTGLGLLMSHKIILAHQGTIDISSVVGQGTTVSIALPVLKAHASLH